MSTDRLRVRQLDPHSLRGIAHPLRMRLLSSLKEYGPATASQLAARLGESSGATSYHLRQLAEYGFVEDDPERGTGRERWWKSVYDGTRVDSVSDLLNHADPEVRGALNLFLQEIAANHTLEVATFLGTTHEWSDEWREAADMSDSTLRLTPRQLRELAERLHSVIESYRGGSEDAEGAETVRIHLHAFPRPPEATA